MSIPAFSHWEITCGQRFHCCHTFVVPARRARPRCVRNAAGHGCVGASPRSSRHSPSTRTVRSPATACTRAGFEMKRRPARVSASSASAGRAVSALAAAVDDSVGAGAESAVASSCADRQTSQRPGLSEAELKVIEKRATDEGRVRWRCGSAATRWPPASGSRPEGPVWRCLRGDRDRFVEGQPARLRSAGAFGSHPRGPRGRGNPPTRRASVSSSSPGSA